MKRLEKKDTLRGMTRLETGQGLVFGTNRSVRVSRTTYDIQSLTAEFQIGQKHNGDSYKFLIKTYGCQMNEHDSEMMAGMLKAMGYVQTDVIDEADLILFNTCAVREHAEDKVFGEVGRLRPMKNTNPELILGLCGCMAQEKGVQAMVMEKFPWIDLVFGTHNIHRLPNLVMQARQSMDTVMEVWDKAAETVEDIPKSRKENVRAWVNIQYGCNKFCTYCIVPYTRGAERSRQADDIIREIEQLVAEGYQEVTLLGQNVNDYGVDLGNINFAQLLQRVNCISGIGRIRFMTSNPWNFTNELISVIANSEHIVPHIHLPMQSGNNEVLRRMNRTYTREYYLDLVQRIRGSIPGVSLTTDIIVGFPSETEDQFEDTMSLVREVQYDNAFTFIFSARDNTPAANFEDDTPYEEKKARLQKLNDLQYAISLEQNKKLYRGIVEVLVEGTSKTNANVMAGRTKTNKLVLFPGDKSLAGHYVMVRVTEPQTWLLKGELVLEIDAKGELA